MSATPGVGAGALDRPAVYDTSEEHWQSAVKAGRVCVGYARDARAAQAVGDLSSGRLTTASKHLRDCPGIECVHVMSETDLNGLGERGTLEQVWEWWRQQQVGWVGLEYTESLKGGKTTGEPTGRAAAANGGRPHMVRLFTVNHGISGQDTLSSYRTPQASVSAEKWCSPFTRASLAIMERVWVVFHARPSNPLRRAAPARQCVGQASAASARKPQTAQARAALVQAEPGVKAEPGGRAGPSPLVRGAAASKLRTVTAARKPRPANQHLGRFQDTHVGLCASVAMVQIIARAQAAGQPFGDSWSHGGPATVDATFNRDQTARDWQQREQVKGKSRQETEAMAKSNPMWFLARSGDAMYACIGPGSCPHSRGNTRARRRPCSQARAGQSTGTDQASGRRRDRGGGGDGSRQRGRLPYHALE